MLTGGTVVFCKRSAVSRSLIGWNPGIFLANSSYTENWALEMPPTFKRMGSGILAVWYESTAASQCRLGGFKMETNS